MLAEIVTLKQLVEVWEQTFKMWIFEHENRRKKHFVALIARERLMPGSSRMWRWKAELRIH